MSLNLSIVDLLDLPSLVCFGASSGKIIAVVYCFRPVVSSVADQKYLRLVSVLACPVGARRLGLGRSAFIRCENICPMGTLALGVLANSSSFMVVLRPGGVCGRWTSYASLQLVGAFRSPPEIPRVAQS